MKAFKEQKLHLNTIKEHLCEPNLSASWKYEEAPPHPLVFFAGLDENIFTKPIFCHILRSLSRALKRSSSPASTSHLAATFALFMSPPFPFFSPPSSSFPFSLSFFFLKPNTEIETVSGLICNLPVHQLPRCLDKFYALCSANIKTVLGSASRSLIKNSLIKSSCKM